MGRALRKRTENLELVWFFRCLIYALVYRRCRSIRLWGMHHEKALKLVVAYLKRVGFCVLEPAETDINSLGHRFRAFLRSFEKEGKVIGAHENTCLADISISDNEAETFHRALPEDLRSALETGALIFDYSQEAMNNPIAVTPHIT